MYGRGQFEYGRAPPTASAVGAAAATYTAIVVGAAAAAVGTEVPSPSLDLILVVGATAATVGTETPSQSLDLVPLDLVAPNFRLRDRHQAPVVLPIGIKVAPSSCSWQPARRSTGCRA